MLKNQGVNTMPNWKTAFRSFYYANAPEPDDLELPAGQTALLIIDVQNTYLTPPTEPEESLRWHKFRQRMNELVIPNTASLMALCRSRNIPVVFARIACLTPEGRDRSLSQKKPGFNNLLLPKDAWESQIVDALAPHPNDIVVTKTTDSALTGTNLRLVLDNMEIRHVICAGIFTDQCVSSTVRSLADESFDVVVVEDCCAAATDELHTHELTVLNWIYCQVVSSEDVARFIRV
jgi:nicotinamidase-related amidase